MKVFKQAVSDSVSCGPIALINLYSLIGVPVKKTDLTALRKLCKVELNKGTYYKDLRQTSKKLGIKLKTVQRTKAEVRKALNRGPLLTAYSHEFSEHYITAFLGKDNEVGILNVSSRRKRPVYISFDLFYNSFTYVDASYGPQILGVDFLLKEAP